MKQDPYEVNTDFGFSFENDATEIKDALDKSKSKVANLKSALYTIQSMIHPLLNNLMKEPEKTTIKWPNRAEKIADFKKHIDDFIEETMDINK